MTTNVVYPADGTNDLFAVPFPYLDKSHVYVFLDGAQLPITAFTWETSGEIRFVSAPPAGSQVGIYRLTPAAPLTDYQAGTTVTTEELETDSLQALYRIEEIANGTIGGVYDVDGNFVWDAKGHRIVNVGDAVLEGDAVNRRMLLQMLGDVVSQGLNTDPKYWEIAGDGVETTFFIPGADVFNPVFYDVFVGGVGLEPEDGFTVAVSPDPTGSTITFATPPAAGVETWVILRGYAKPTGSDLFTNEEFLALLRQLILNTLYETTNVLRLGPLSFLIPLYDVVGIAETVDGTKQGYLLRTTNAAPTEVTIRANSGDPLLDWTANPIAAPFFSVKQVGTGQVTLIPPVGGAFTVPSGYLPKTRGPGSIITATADYIAGGAWTLSGDLAIDPNYQVGGSLVSETQSSAGVLSLDLELSRNFKVSLFENITSIVLTNLPGVGKAVDFEVEFTQDATGGRTVTFPASFKALGGSDTTVNAAALGSSILSAKSFDNGATWRFVMQESAP